MCPWSLLGHSNLSTLSSPLAFSPSRALLGLSLPPPPCSEVPRELEQDLVLQYGPDVESVGVSLVDKSSEDYVPPKEVRHVPYASFIVLAPLCSLNLRLLFAPAPVLNSSPIHNPSRTPHPQKFSFAKSQGHSMVSGAESKSAGTGAGAGSFANAPAAEYHADKSKPTANIQIVLHPRQRVTAVFNLDATVLQLYQHIKHLSSAPSFSMLAGFPPVALTDGSKTIAEAKLAGASVQQKL